MNNNSDPDAVAHRGALALEGLHKAASSLGFSPEQEQGLMQACLGLGRLHDPNVRKGVNEGLGEHGDSVSPLELGHTIFSIR